MKCDDCGETSSDKFYSYKKTKCKRCLYLTRKESARKWATENRDRVASSHKKYRNNNKEKVKAATDKWKLENKAHVMAHYKKRIQRKRQSSLGSSSEYIELITAIYKAAKLFEMAYPDEKFHVDHIVPLKHPKVCGLHVPWNLRVLTDKDNLKKKNKFDGTAENESWRRDA